MRYLYPEDWTYQEEPANTQGRDEAAAISIIQASVPPGGTPLTVRQVLELVCGSNLNSRLGRQLSMLRRQIVQKEAEHEAMEDGPERVELAAVIQRLRTSFRDLRPPHFGNRPQLCIRRVLNGLPVIAPPETRALRKHEVKRLIQSEIQRRLELNPPPAPPEAEIIQ